LDDFFPFVLPASFLFIWYAQKVKRRKIFIWLCTTPFSPLQVWPYEESDEFGFVQGLFSMMRALFSCDSGAPTVGKLAQSSEVSQVSFRTTI
jgi:hypothetical protein